ncbi:hypothetical protein Clacol_006126 [Clathrus columnatus]|uniref:Alginate lyase domain-containing protein n=1 Tax=Clathrus columnatus TaxID=1419009 RepID=A0AAV5AFI0_9AGAM|nr:hypothetical protein Clacol_006126 [Clathrus columnatus]
MVDFLSFIRKLLVDKERNTLMKNKEVQVYHVIQGFRFGSVSQRGFRKRIFVFRDSNPDYVLNETFPDSLGDARETILQWTGQVNALGPWSVLNKTITPPSGDKHDYMSWAPYSWPNCTGVGNTTVLTPEEVWVTCPYVLRDGQFNPDGRLIDDIGEFSNLADAVLFNALSWVLSGRPTALYAVNAVNYIKIWFLDSATKMNPNLNYAQMARGPTGQIGTHTGILDTKCFTKIITGILILKQGNCALWTPDLDSQMTSWVQQFVQWLETAPTAIEESKAVNNHGSFYFTQLASLKLYLNDTAGALNVTTTYFTNQFQNQILGNGEQPFEAIRTRPYHYRAYNLCAMITNARLQNYMNKTSNVWNWKTKYGATIQTALDFAINVPPWVSNETSHQSEMDPNVAAIKAVYGDPTNGYTNFLQFRESNYTAQPYWYWYQSLDSLAGSTQPSPSPTPVKNSDGKPGERAKLSKAEKLDKVVPSGGSIPYSCNTNIVEYWMQTSMRQQQMVYGNLCMGDMGKANTLQQTKVISCI